MVACRNVKKEEENMIFKYIKAWGKKYNSYEEKCASQGVNHSTNLYKENSGKVCEKSPQENPSRRN